MELHSANLLILIPNTKVKSYFYLFFTNYYAYRRKTKIWNQNEKIPFSPLNCPPPFPHNSLITKGESRAFALLLITF